MFLRLFLTVFERFFAFFAFILSLARNAKKQKSAFGDDYPKDALAFYAADYTRFFIFVKHFFIKNFNKKCRRKSRHFHKRAKQSENHTKYLTKTKEHNIMPAMSKGVHFQRVHGSRWKWTPFLLQRGLNGQAVWKGSPQSAKQDRRPDRQPPMCEHDGE